ncbi:hypothetical protein F8M41_004821 [Gigaspora margarita]|uniref:Uncharacterized protein n=1 Tax=Gigaspora margarita TaxID=4874 RepID=A0A8H4A6M8_GIGMA|nr:hypothetical protein F8M41_004821 [Gigaspora margarita]
MLFGSMVQGSDPVGQFYSKLRKLARLAGIDEQQIRLQFIHGISPDNQLEIRRIRINRPVSKLLTELEEIERYKTEQLSGAYSIPKSAIERQQQFYSNADINKLVEERIASREKQSLVSEKRIFEAKPKQVSQVDSNTKTIRQFIEIMKQAKKTLAKKPGPGKEKADKIHIDRFLDEVLENIGDNPDPSSFHDNSDPIEDIRKQMEDLHINQTKIAKAIKNISSKPKSSRRKTKSKSKSKTQKKKSSKYDSSETSSKSSSSESDSDEYEVNATKKKITYSDTKSSKKRKSARPLLHNKTSSKKSSNTSSDKKSSKNIRILKIPTDNISLNAFFAILRSMVDSFTHTQPKEVTINGYNMINAEFIALKDPVLNHFTSNFSDKEQEKFWNEITMVFLHILQPISDLIRIASQQANTLSQKAPEEMQPEAKISWPNPIEINFIRKIIPNDVATITCQITSPSGKNIQVPVHKSQREIFKPEINLTFHKQDSVQVSTDSSRPEESLLRRPEGVTLKGHSPSSKDKHGGHLI